MRTRRHWILRSAVLYWHHRMQLRSGQVGWRMAGAMFVSKIWVRRISTNLKIKAQVTAAASRRGAGEAADSRSVAIYRAHKCRGMPEVGLPLCTGCREVRNGPPPIGLHVPDLIACMASETRRTLPAVARRGQAEGELPGFGPAGAALRLEARRISSLEAHCREASVTSA